MSSARQYINLTESLSQAWLDHTVLFLVLATLKVYFFSSALISMISLVRETSLPLCRRLESFASEMEQAPAQMSLLTTSIIQTLGANIHTLIEKSVYLSAAVARGIVTFLLELYLGTLTCLITALIKGTLELVSEILDDITSIVQNAINAVLKEFNSALSGLSSVINKVTSAVNAVESLFTSSDKSSVANNISKVNLTVASLTSITIPTTWISDIDNLANEVPDFEEVLSNASAVLTAPITDLTKQFSNASFNFAINKSFLTNETSLSPTFAATVIKRSDLVNATQSVCDDVDDVFSDTIAVTRSLADYIILGLCIFTVAYAVVIWVFSYFRMRKRARLYAALAEVNNPIEVGNTIGRFDNGFMTMFLNRLSPESQWLYSYLHTPNLRKCLFLGLLGWLIVFLQFITLQEAAKILNEISANGIITTATSSNLADEFSQYLDEAQQSLDHSVEQINEVLFSSIHNTTSSILNEINFFQTSVNDTINAVFGSSFLANPLRTIIYCTIGRKVDSIEEGLQWIEKNTVFDSPSLDKSYMDAAFQDSLPDVSGLQSGVTDNVVAAVQKIITSQRRVLWKEFFIATAFIAMWFVYAIVGLLLLANRKTQNRKNENRVSTQAISWPSQLCEEAQREYSYPYNDPYGVPIIGRQGEQDSVISKPNAIPEVVNGQQSSLQESPCGQSDFRTRQNSRN